MNFLSELRRRNVIRMAGLYLVAAWLVTQIAGTLLPMFDAPAWIARSVVIVLAIGFIPALLFAWVFELTPEGLKRDAEVAPEQSIAPQTAQRMDRGIIVVLMLALAFFAVDRFVLAPQRNAALVAAATQSVKVDASVRLSPAPSEQSIAVLAFANMSPDKDNEYFSDGVAEEILNALAHVQDLKVAGRTSSFYFKGRNEPLAAIGSALGVAHVLEGSVRKQGNRLRVTAQLIRISDGFHLWSETFDGTDADVFALQESIARQVTDSLQVKLNAGQQDRLVNAGTTNHEAYSLYLQATAIFNRRDRGRFQDAIAALQRAGELDPGFTRAFARLASMYVVVPSYTDADPWQAHDQAMRYAAKALALDAGSAEAWAARGASLRKFPGKQVQCRDAFEQAIQLDSSDPNSTFWYGLTLLTSGYRRAGTLQIERALALDPMLPNALRWRGMLYLQDGDIALAEPLLQRAHDLGLATTAGALSEIAMAQGDSEASVRLWLDGSFGFDFGMTRDELVIVHRGIFGNASAKQAGVNTLLEALRVMGGNRAFPLMPLYLFRLDQPALGLTVLRERQLGDSIDSMNWIWTRQGAPIRALPEFDDFLSDFHLPELWDKYGPPDLCHKAAAGGYVCE